MANMKIISMVAHEARRAQAENQQAIETALDVIEDELNSILAKIQQLGADVDALMNPGSPVRTGCLC
jgi:hypothetical protein